MAEAFLFPLAKKLIENLASASFREIGRIYGVKSDLKRLEHTLSSIKAVLADAAQRQINSEQVRNWVRKLQDVLYEMDDLFDDFNTEQMRRELEIGDSKRKEVSNFFSGSNKILFRLEMRKKISKLRKRLDEINQDRRNFQFVERGFADRGVRRIAMETHSYVHVPDVFGRDREKEKVLNILLDPKSRESNLCILPVVGLGGLGKTTLAKLVYNDPQIQANFDKKIWVCVSDDFDTRKLVKKILEADSGEQFPELALDPLRTHLQNRLRSQKFMLVLDDVWNRDKTKWGDLEQFLTCGAPGSTILVTTRIMEIAKLVGTFEPFSLSGLPSDDCMSIFLKHAFKDGHWATYPKLMEIGEEMVEKCRGHPLAVVTVASLVCTTTDQREWESVRDNEIWRNQGEENLVLSILRLSYERMPTHLKQCFAYCSTYPKDIVMGARKLTMRWISNGLIQPSDTNSQLEEIGHVYVKELISLSFFQDVAYTFSDEVLTFRMHDLVHDLALAVSSNEVVYSDTSQLTNVNICRIIFTDGYGSLDEKAFPELQPRNARSIGFKYEVGPVNVSWIDAFVKSFQLLREVDIGALQFKTLPDSIGTLRHLRFLWLYNNKLIISLPNSVSKLLNLIALDVGGCDKLQRLPPNFHNLRRLRCFALTSQMMCFVENDLQGLGDLREFRIYKCQQLESLSDGGLKHLTSLRRLIIKHCPKLISVPKSMKFLSSLKKLYIDECEELDLLEGRGFQGLRSLEDLILGGLPKLIESPLGVADFAPNLKYLQIANCPRLRSVDGLQNCTSLLKLSIINCMSLSSLSSDLHHLTGLEIYKCPLLAPKCKRETGEYWPWIHFIPKTDLDKISKAECPTSEEKDEAECSTSRGNA